MIGATLSVLAPDCVFFTFSTAWGNPISGFNDLWNMLLWSDAATWLTTFHNHASAVARSCEFLIFWEGIFYAVILCFPFPECMGLVEPAPASSLRWSRLVVS